MKKLTIREIVEQFEDLDKMLQENDWKAVGSYEIRTKISGYSVVLTLSSDDEDEE